MITKQKQNELIEAAYHIRNNAYAPYSNYPVGAALLTKSGKIFTGVNVENASYGLSNCAERTAIFNMVSQGEQEIITIAISTKNGGAPCGACRQVLVEFSPHDIPVYLCAGRKLVHKTTVYTLIPHHFHLHEHKTLS